MYLQVLELSTGLSIVASHRMSCFQFVVCRKERIIDGDTIRIRHCPTRFSCPEPDSKTRRIYDSTLSIRLYGVDCPELQKRKSDAPSQPFAAEAKDFTSDLLLNKKVRIKLLRKDQYGRAVAKVEGSRRLLPPFNRKDVSLELVRNGLATIYEGGGAEYDGNIEILKNYQRTAEKRKRGVWSQAQMMSPAEFKRQQKQLNQAPSNPSLQ